MTTRAALATQRETLRLAVAIADEEAQCYIECNCTDEIIDGVIWWDTTGEASGLDDGADDDYGLVVTLRNCVHYLELRDMIVRHPATPGLVRFVARIELPRPRA